MGSNILKQNSIQRSFATLAAASFFSGAPFGTQSNSTKSTPSPLSTPSGLSSQTSTPAESKLVNLQADNRVFFLDLDGKKNVPVIIKQISVDSTDRVETINFLRQDDNGKAGTLKAKDVSPLNKEEIQRVYLENVKKIGGGIAPSSFPPNPSMLPIYFGINGISVEGSYKNGQFKPFDLAIKAVILAPNGAINVLTEKSLISWNLIDDIGKKNILGALESTRSNQWYSGDGREKAWNKFNELMDDIEVRIRESAKVNKIDLDPEVSRLLARQNRKELNVARLSNLPKAALLKDINYSNKIRTIIAELKHDEKQWNSTAIDFTKFGFNELKDRWGRKASFQESVDLMERWQTVVFR